MSKIKSINISNFKFFRSHPAIELNGNHLLLYGENGSGKSSIYYGLYTILQAATKLLPDVQKYFTPGNNEFLLNIYADTQHGPENTGAHICIEDMDNRSYKLSFSETGCMADPNLLESNRASDFMNYVSLFRFQLFRNSESADLHDVFRLSILPSISFSAFNFQGKVLRGAEDMYLAYKGGPGITQNRNGKKILVYKCSPEYRNFQALEDHFNDRMQDLINFIGANVNSKIQEFGYDFEVKLEYVPAKHLKKDTWIDYTQRFGVYLSITKYNGKAVDIVHPNTFLNEAKMAALAFSIRWAILDYRLNAGAIPQAMKVLVLDDIMISLDMANRNKLIRVITNQLAQQYQILFLTHDMQIYDCMKNELMSLYDKKKEEDLKETNWTLMELYDVERDGVHEPFFQMPMSDYSKARKYFFGKDCTIDYAASGNYIRKALEAAFKNLFRKANLTHNANGEAIEYDKLMIGSCIDLARNYKDHLGISTALINKIESLRNCMLNAASHHNPGRNFYSQEILEAFNVYECLTRYDAQVIVPKREAVNFKIVCTDGTEHDYVVTPKHDLVACRLLDANTYTIFWKEDNYEVQYSSAGVQRGLYPKNKTLQQIFIECYQFLSNGDNAMRANFPNAIDVISYKGQTLRERINQL